MKIVVTGSSSGIGRGLAERLLARGHEVCGLARRDQQDFAAGHGGRFVGAVADVADWDAVEAVAEAVRARWGTIDGLVTCAGLQGAVGPALAADPRAWSETVRANLDGTFHAVRAFAALLHQQDRRAKVVCFSGGGATKARVNFSAYAVAKTGIVRLVENLAEELKGQPIDINAVAPGAINTRLTEEVLRLGPGIVGAEEFAAATKQVASGGGSLERALDLVEWLLSPDSDGVSGRLLSAPWDPWPAGLRQHVAELARSEVYMLRRITPAERNLRFE